MQSNKSKRGTKRAGRPQDIHRFRIIDHFEKGIASGQTISAIAKTGIMLCGLSLLHGKTKVTVERHLEGAKADRTYRRYRAQNERCLSAARMPPTPWGDGDVLVFTVKRLVGISLPEGYIAQERSPTVKRGRPKKSVRQNRVY